MAKNWQDVKMAIHAEAERIWFDEPEEVTMSKLGVFPSGGRNGSPISRQFAIS